MWENDPYGKHPGPYVDKVLEYMQKVGAVRLEASYEGGNDEGGISGINVFVDKDGKDVEQPPWSAETGEVYPEGHFNAGKPVTQYDPTGFWQSLDNILSTRYGSWAGDFSAYGTLFVDVQERRAWTEGEMSTYTYDSETIEYTF